MNEAKSRTMNCDESCLGYESDREKFGIKEEKVYSSATLDKMELIENDENCHLSHYKKDTESLESIQNYAQRIKSFLGWDPHQEEQNESEIEPVDGSLNSNLTSSLGDSESVDKERDSLKGKMDCLNVISNNEEDDKKESESALDYMENDRNLSNTLADDCTDVGIKNSEDRVIESENGDKNRQNSTPETEIIKMDLKNNNVIPNRSDSKNKEKSNKDISMESVSSDFTCENEDENRNFKEGENVRSETELKKLTCSKEEKEQLELSCIPDSKTDFMKDPGEFVSTCNPELNDDVEKEKSDSVFEGTKDSSSDIDLSKKENKNDHSEMVFGYVSHLERDMYPKEDEIENNELQPKKLDTSENLPKDSTIDENENYDADDLKSEDSLDLDETFLSNDDLPKNYVKEIRRLSRGIVKDVIESARNSVHELYASESENLNSISQSEKLAKDNLELYFNNEKQMEDDTSEFYENFSKEIFDRDSDYERGKTEEDPIGDEDTICGFGCFKPRWMQKYATPRAFLTIFSIIGVINGCYYPYVTAILSTLEKRYAFKTKVSTTLLLADEITPLILGILVGYIGGKTHRPRMVAIGMFLCAICSFISGSPYIIYGTSINTSYFDDKHKIGLKFCESGTNATQCNTDELPPTLTVVGIFLVASFLKGCATLSYYVIGFSYMDDIIEKKDSPVYFAIALALRLLGPLLGFLMSSGFLKYYENPLYDPGFGSEDPRWIGAWWIGFFLQGVLLVIFTIPIAFFPRRLPSQKRIEKVDVTAQDEGLKELFRGMVSALKRLGRNPVFIVLIIQTTMKIFGHFGHAIMLPKYMENQFRLSASEASLYSGAISIVCIIIATVLGGFLIWKFRPRIKVLLGGMIASETTLCIGYLILMIPRCQTSEMLHFGMNEEGLILNSACNQNCDCSTSSFTPFCGPDGNTLYFSPCYAGCTEEMNITISKTYKMNKKFDNCSCVDEKMGSTITEGFCPDENCGSKVVAYLIVYFFLVTLSNLFTVAATMILLRSVHPNDKSLALGTFETFICLFGFIPFPVTYGALVDSACLVWEKSCGETGNCWFYDMEKYSYLLHGASSLFCFLCLCCLITLYFLSSRIRDLYKEEDEEEKKYVDIKLDTVSGTVTKL